MPSEKSECGDDDGGGKCGSLKSRVSEVSPVHAIQGFG